jgi:hypothetical protein
LLPEPLGERGPDEASAFIAGPRDEVGVDGDPVSTGDDSLRPVHDVGGRRDVVRIEAHGRGEAGGGDRSRVRVPRGVAEAEVRVIDHHEVSGRDVFAQRDVPERVGIVGRIGGGHDRPDAVGRRDAHGCGDEGDGATRWPAGRRTGRPDRGRRGESAHHPEHRHLGDVELGIQAFPDAEEHGVDREPGEQRAQEATRPRG